MAAISVHNLTYAYPGGRRALDGLSFEIGQGERVALVGPNGAGKSTLLLHLNGIYRGQGEVFIHGAPVDRSHLKAVRCQVGLLFQNPDDQLFMPTVGEDVAFGPMNLEMAPERIPRKVSEALAEVGLAGYEDREPYHLSGGEKKRVALAGLLVMEPSILALDEPTGHLDPRSRRSLIEILRRLPVTQIIATHDMEMALEICTRALLIDRGRLVADGLPPSLFADARLLAEHGLETPPSLRSTVLQGA
ncbi:MAG: ABC transporter ATP-binding protein [Armatimonadetes bacterium]|nr:ABC transporter ATP-binding protein [Armatimonadota bacterium]